MRISFGNRLYLRENFVASFGKMFRLRCGQICRNKFVHIFVACLRRAHFYKAGGEIIRKEARQKARLAKGAAETLFIFCQTRFTLLFTKLIRQTIDIITLTYQNVEYRKDR